MVMDPKHSCLSIKRNARDASGGDVPPCENHADHASRGAKSPPICMCYPLVWKIHGGNTSQKLGLGA